MIDQLRDAVGTIEDDVNDSDIESTISISYTDGTTDTFMINSGINQIGSLTSAQISTLSPCYSIGTGAGSVCIPGLTVGGTQCHINWNTTYGTGTGGGGGGYTFTGINTNPGTVNITDKGIEMAETADIKVGGRSLMAFMKTMEERLAILVPDPAKMEKFAALKKAYDNYKLLEKLCQEEDKVE